LAGESGPQAHPLVQKLHEDPYGFDFYIAVRLLDAARADRPRTGTAEHPWEDTARLCQEPSLAFAPSTVSALKPRTDDAADLPPRLFVNFFGLLGPNGPMPLHITQYARERERNVGDATPARFFDIFNHRLTSLFYRAWASAQQTVSADRPDDDSFGSWIGSLFGLGTEAVQHRDNVPDSAKLYAAGHLVCQTRHSSGLRAIIGDYFSVPTQIQEMAGLWMDLPEDCRLRLGETRRTGTLGSTTIVGSRFWDCQQKFRIRMGPMSLKDYQRLLPTGAAMKRLVDWVRTYTCDEFTWDLRLIMFADQVPQTSLGRIGQLGWTTWLKSKPMTRNVEDLVLRPPV
jgi:type VI secretion system protein ImpH